MGCVSSTSETAMLVHAQRASWQRRSLRPTAEKARALSVRSTGFTRCAAVAGVTISHAARTTRTRTGRKALEVGTEIVWSGVCWLGASFINTWYNWEGDECMVLLVYTCAFCATDGMASGLTTAEGGREGGGREEGKGRERDKSINTSSYTCTCMYIHSSIRTCFFTHRKLKGYTCVKLTHPI